jgi:hypothetical protein
MEQLSEFTTTIFRFASAEPWWPQKEAVAAGPSFSSVEYVEDFDTTRVIVPFQPHKESIGSEIANGPAIYEPDCSVVQGPRSEDCYGTNSSIPSLRPAFQRNRVRFAVDVDARSTGSGGTKAKSISSVRHSEPNCRDVVELAKLHARVARRASSSGTVSATSCGKVKIMPTTIFVV